MNIYYMQMDPVALSIGPLIIRWYALAYLAGFLLGWRYCLSLVSGEKSTSVLNKDSIDDFLTWAIIGVIIGGRLGYVLFYNASYYASEPLEIIKIWNGGMSFHGGMLGVMAAMVLYSAKHKMNVFNLSDVICAAAPIGLFFGRIANFINGELYGMHTGGTWGVVFNDEIAPRHPSQLYEAFLEGIVLFVILRVLIKREQARPGVVTGVFLLGYGIFRALVEFVREPDAHLGLIWDVVSMGQILCLPMIIGGTVIILFASQGKLKND